MVGVYVSTAMYVTIILGVLVCGIVIGWELGKRSRRSR